MTGTLKGKRVAICGGAGLLGHSLALSLKQQGADVSVVDHFLTNNLGRWMADTSPYRDRYIGFLLQRVNLLRQADIPLFSCELRDYGETSHTLKKLDPHTVVHLAAVSHAGKSNRDEHDAFSQSILTLKNVRDYARGTHNCHLIYQSSSMVYGTIQGRALEDDRLDPLGYYGNYKLAAERMVWASAQVDGLAVTVVRPSALYGPRCVSRRVIQIFIEAAMAGEPLLVAGDGTERLDFTFVDDWVQGLLLVIAKPEISIGQTFNIAYGGARSLNDLVNVVRAHFPNVQVDYISRDPTYSLRDTLDCEKARTLLGYTAQWPLERGIAALVEWYRDAS